jgi:hypothetical protein
MLGTGFQIDIRFIETPVELKVEAVVLKVGDKKNRGVMRGTSRRCVDILRL